MQAPLLIGRLSSCLSFHLGFEDQRQGLKVMPRARLLAGFASASSSKDDAVPGEALLSLVEELLTQKLEPRLNACVASALGSEGQHREAYP